MNIDNLITEYRKNGEDTLLGICQLIKAAFIENQHSKNPVSEIEVLQKMIKEREKAVKMYEKANRNDLVKKEANEITFIKQYIPKEPSEEEIKESIKNWMDWYKYVGSIEMKCASLVLAYVQKEYPTAQRSVITKIFRSLL